MTRVQDDTEIATLPVMRGPSMRERFREHMRSVVLEACHDLIVERGWDRVRMGEVADRAGVSRAALYKEFGDKAALGEAVVLREASRFLEGIQWAPDKVIPPKVQWEVGVKLGREVINDGGK